jgi:hypothetical protein
MLNDIIQNDQIVPSYIQFLTTTSFLYKLTIQMIMQNPHVVQFNKAMMNKQFRSAVNSAAYFSRIIG